MGKYIFQLWHILVALWAAYLIWVLCSVYQVAKRDIEARKAWAQYVRDHDDPDGGFAG